MHLQAALNYGLKTVQLSLPYFLFATTASYLFVLLLTVTSSSMFYPYGADLVGLNSSFDRIGNDVAQCNGLWDCYHRSCNLFQIPNISYVALREHYENAICSISYNNVINQTSNWSVLAASKQLLIVAVLVEAFSGGLLIIRLLWQCFEIVPRNAMITVWNIGFAISFLGGPLCLLTVSVLLDLFNNNLNSMKGQDLPTWLITWLMIPGVLLLITLFISCGQVLLVLHQRNEDDYERLY